MSQSLSQLPIDECEEWIWDILDCTKDCGFEYISGDGKEFLILNTNDFYADTKALYKIKRLTGMKLMQMSMHNGNGSGFSGRNIPHGLTIDLPCYGNISTFQFLFLERIKLV
jgi:hypothetical protein